MNNYDELLNLHLNKIEQLLDQPEYWRGWVGKYTGFGWREIKSYSNIMVISENLADILKFTLADRDTYHLVFDTNSKNITISIKGYNVKTINSYDDYKNYCYYSDIIRNYATAYFLVENSKKHLEQKSLWYLEHMISSEFFNEEKCQHLSKTLGLEIKNTKLDDLMILYSDIIESELKEKEEIELKKFKKQINKITELNANKIDQTIIENQKVKEQNNNFPFWKRVKYWIGLNLKDNDNE